MALTGCTEVIIKEFIHLPAGTCTRLVQGFKDDVSAYYAVFHRTGLNLPVGEAGHGHVTEFAISDCSRVTYKALAKKFKEIVSPML